MPTRKYIILCMALVFLTACAGVPKSTSAPAEIKEIREPVFPIFTPSRPAEGSLWSDVSGVDLFQDSRARKVGDIVTVRIVEDPEAELNANTKTSRSSSVTAAKLKLLGYMKQLADKNSTLAQNPGTDDLFTATLAMDFDGKGSSDRDGHIKAYIAAVVERVLPNGNLYINGRREIKVNKEMQFITISGIIRPEDISPANEISSTYVAAARILYAGKGPVADKQNPGWLGRVVDYVWPF